MSFLDFANKLKLVVDELNNTREEESIIIANETAALIRLRVQNDKVDANGNSFGGYSQAVVPKWFYFGRSLSQGAEDTIDNGPYFQSYEDFKQANNQEIDAKNYTFSGEMWRDTGVTTVENSSGSTTVTIGGQTERAASLMAFNTERDGPILEASDKEIQFIVEAHEERVFGIIDKIFQ